LLAGIIHIPGLQPTFGTVSLSIADWFLAFGVAGLTSVIDAGAEKIYDRLPIAKETLTTCQPAPMSVV